MSAPSAPWAKHGLSRHPLYSTWRGILSRCENPWDESYPRYGGRGIAVCPEWHDVAVFVAWIEENLGPRPEGQYPGGQPVYTLDRVDNNGNYEAGNVEWRDRKQQALNRGARSKATVTTTSGSSWQWCS
jgi:hypothetical protein